ncbi:hypothetical protein BDZ94DRAFT_5246 [Collybia nuda]|uniref:F-box domain-containing protein n=1 Tax=Collybia nuda TaxID=64659 RepID=A0A9P6CK49_9AGAR|nr:hypothetical protein BDZ94DRAFT_5246 [Collybia nuda]
MKVERTTSTSRPTTSRKKRKLDEQVVSTQKTSLPEGSNAQLQSTQRIKRRGNIGKLSGLLDLPLDILFEIFGQLAPYDLLKLSRMTKEFRRVLMHKSSISVWKSTLERVPGLPICPNDMPEPQWVNLAFDPHCHFCFTSNIRNVEWTLRVRICSKCAKDHIVDSLELSYYQSEDDIAYESLISSRPAKRMRRGYLIRDLLAVQEKYKSMKDSATRKAYILMRRNLVKDIQHHAVLCEIWSQSQLSQRSYELQQLREDRLQAIIERLEGLGWEKDVQSIEYPDSLEEHKLVKRPQRLTDSIWGRIKGPILEFMAGMREKRLLRERAELILERKNTAAQFLRTYKNARLPYIEILPERLDFSEFPPIKTILELPSEVDVTEATFDSVLPQLPSLIEGWRGEINQKMIRTMKVNEVAARQHASISRMMLLWGEDPDEMDHPELDESTSTETDEEAATRMKLATTVFQCNTCTEYSWWHDDDDLSSKSSEGSSMDEWSASDESSMALDDVVPLFYPDVLGHLCLTRAPHRFWSWGRRVDACKRLDSMTKIRRKWTSRPLRVDRTIGKYAESVVRAAGLDPEITTVAEMDALDIMFGCMRCILPVGSYSDHTGYTMAYGWREAVAHHAEHHGRGTPKWHTLTPDALESARADENDAVEVSPGTTASSVDLPVFPSVTEVSDAACWLCVHCRDLPSEMEPSHIITVRFHIQTKHDITKPEINRDYYREFNPHPSLPTATKVILDMRLHWI